MKSKARVESIPVRDSLIDIVMRLVLDVAEEIHSGYVERERFRTHIAQVKLESHTHYTLARQLELVYADNRDRLSVADRQYVLTTIHSILADNIKRLRREESGCLL